MRPVSCDPLKFYVRITLKQQLGRRAASNCCVPLQQKGAGIPTAASRKSFQTFFTKVATM